MALTGHLSDLSLSELIEFFCNQRKTGQLKVLYPQGPGYFYLQTGSVVDARIGVLRGIDAVYYALTLPNANFEFGAAADLSERTINQPWTQVVLEGLRRLDEGVVPLAAFPPDYQDEGEAPVRSELVDAAERAHGNVPAFLSLLGSDSAGKRKFVMVGAVSFAVLASVAAIGVPAGWYSHAKTTVVASQPVVTAAATEPVAAPPAETSQPVGSAEADALAAKRQHDKDREKERAKAREEKSAALNSAAGMPTASANDQPKAGAKRISVTVSYDESGRVTQASGGDASAIRIARQKRFPPGKAGSATVTIPIN
jgi:hypothetical protein